MPEFSPEEQTLQELRMLRAEYEASLKTALSTEERFRFYRLVQQLNDAMVSLERQSKRQARAELVVGVRDEHGRD